MKNPEKTWLFITRAQPGLHYGHIDWLNQWKEAWITKFIVGIWSSNKEWTSENPFTYMERKKMVEITAKNIWDLIQTEVYSIHDFGNNEEWINYILRELPDFDYVISGNPRVIDAMQKAWKEIIPLKIRKMIKWSTIRELIARNQVQKLWEYISDEWIDYLQRINAPKRLKNIFKQEWKWPGLTVDAVVFDKNWKIVLIQRKNPPYGVALPWGFVDIWESLIDAAKRETMEEISVPVEIQKSDYLGYWDDPDRDPRAHNISHAFRANMVDWELKAADDAKSIVLVDPNELENINFAFPDHKEMILKTLKEI